MKKQPINSLLDPDFYYCWVNKGLLFSLSVCGLLTCIVLILMFGMWFEFSVDHHDVFLYIDNTLADEQQTIVSIMKSSKLFNADDVLLIFSSRDSSSLLSMFILWGWSLYGVLGMTLCKAVVGMYQQKYEAAYKKFYKVIVPVVLFILIYLGSEFVRQTPPHQLGGYYLLQITASLFLILTAYIAVRYVQKRETLSSKKSTLIAYASQSGTAKNIALKMANSSHINCDIRNFSQLTPQCLLGYNQLFVVASTYGEGQAPEKSVGFTQALTLWKDQLSHLSYAVLALGDRAYPQFCAFGHHIDTLLNNKGANVMRPVQEIDRGDPLIITRWWQDIGELLGWNTIDMKNEFMDGVIVSNECLNSQQTHRPAHAVTINVNNVKYQAGDLLEILTPTPLKVIDKKLLEFGLEPKTIVYFNEQQCQLKEALTQLEWTNQVANSAQALVDKLLILRPRVYSIASAPNNNKIRLLIRELKKDDGSVGFSSSALCNALPHQSFKVAIREHDSFRLPDLNTPIIMIAAGTGIAPFMSFLAERGLQKRSDNWLIFGERYSTHDNYFNNELDAYIESGVLNQLDYAFSRDQEWLKLAKPRYVDDVIVQQAQQVSDWLLNKGAYLYVCGNKSGMGESVKSALKQLLTQDADHLYERLKKDNRLHFDLY